MAPQSVHSQTINAERVQGMGVRDRDLKGRRSGLEPKVTEGTRLLSIPFQSKGGTARAGPLARLMSRRRSFPWCHGK
eukprot:2489088-Pyramimonas_sp.AAC.1